MRGCQVNEDELGCWVMVAGRPYFAYFDLPEGADVLGEVRVGKRRSPRRGSRTQVGVLFPSDDDGDGEPFAIQATGTSTRLLWRKVGAIQVIDPDSPVAPASWVIVLARRRALPASLAAAAVGMGVAASLL